MIVLSKSQGFLLKQALIKHHKDTFGSNYKDHAKCGYGKVEDLTEAHEQCDLAYLIKANRQFIMLLHDAVYPKGSKLTKATTKLQSLLDGPLVKKVLQGTSLGDQDDWGEQENRKTFFQIDTEFESMMTVVKSNFVTVDSFASSMRASLRQALIHKLAYVKSPDQAAWIKSEDYIAGLLNDDQMLSIENTDQAIKLFENYASRAIEPTTTVLLSGASHDDNPEMVTMRAELAEMKALVATLGATSIPTVTAGAAHTGKRTRVHNNAKTTMSKVVITCTVYK